MTIPIANTNISGSFVPTTFILDVARIEEADVNSPEFKELLVRLYQNLNRMVLALNVKNSGFYALNQFVTGQQYFPSVASTSLVQANWRPVTRLVINFGALPNAGAKAVAHNININAGVTFTTIYGTANDTTDNKYIPLPYASPTLNKNIQLDVTSTDVIVTTAIDYSAYTITYIVLEFLTQS